LRHVLVVDDDPGMRRLIAEYLEGRDFRVSRAAGGAEMARHLERGDVDLVVLDVRLEREDGFDLVRALRGRSDTPIILITGQRRDETDRIVGLELGADDYLTKPFGLGELLARIRAVLRRVETAAARDRQASRAHRTYHFAGWRLRTRDRSLVSDGGQPATLTAGETRLLLTFLGSPQQLLTREQLQDGAGLSEEVFDRSVDVRVLRLRRKLEVDPSAPAIITTSRGAGYTLAVPVQVE
jgi:two-component system OmpR family response regulator